MEPLPELSEEEFEHIEEAIARTAKGRAFLRRFHRRSLGAASGEVRVMLEEFRASWRQHMQSLEAAKHVEVLRRELLEMAGSIEQARREVAALRPPDGASDKILSATNELDAIVLSTERASIEILNAAERLMDLSGKLKADGANAILCTEIESEVTSIFTACSFQDLTGQRTSKVVNALRYIEQRINAVIGIWGDEAFAGAAVERHEPADSRPDAHLLNGPQLPGQGVSQADVDSLFDAPTPTPHEAAPSVASSQSDIDRLFDDPTPAPEPTPPPVRASTPRPVAVAARPAPAPAAPSAATKPPSAVEAEPPTPLDQAAIDALFG